MKKHFAYYLLFPSILLYLSCASIPQMQDHRYLNLPGKHYSNLLFICGGLGISWNRELENFSLKHAKEINTQCKSIREIDSFSICVSNTQIDSVLNEKKIDAVLLLSFDTTSSRLTFSEDRLSWLRTRKIVSSPVKRGSNFVDWTDPNSPMVYLFNGIPKNPAIEFSTEGDSLFLGQSTYRCKFYDVDSGVLIWEAYCTVEHKFFGSDVYGHLNALALQTVKKLSESGLLIR